MSMNDVKQQQQRNVKWEYLVSGTAGGVVATAVFHPLELIKVRYQVNEYSKPKLFNYFNKVAASSIDLKQQRQVYRPDYRNLADTLVKIYKTENGVKGLYRGLSINVFASGSAWGLYFLIYNTLKSHRKNQTQLDNASLLGYTIDATLAGMITISITNPLFLIKTRMCLQYGRGGEKIVNDSKHYKNSIDALKHLLKTDGLKGLYKGIIPGYLGTINGTIQMVTYDNMKYFYLKYLRKKYKNEQIENLNSHHYLVFSGISKCLAVVCTYPFQLVRARLQDQYKDYTSLYNVIKVTFKSEGVLGFYKGLVPCLLRVTPAAAVTFLTYENLLAFLL